MLSEAEGRECGFGACDVIVVHHYNLQLADGVNLGTKLWLPKKEIAEKNFGDCPQDVLYQLSGDHGNEEKFPVILEYIPYRKSDSTAPRDHRRHTWMTSHGYVVARVDMRGSGDSEGLYHDEYTVQEQDDAVEVIDWLSKQEWYATDVHYMGGCLLATQMISWNATMFAFNARPPNPHYVPNWRQEWQKRLEKATSPFGSIWMRHQLKDGYWRQGSVCEDFTRLKIPILAIGGWVDSYRDAVFRLLEGSDMVKGLIGPWGHDWPDEPKPGPVIAYMDECLKWWDCYLKGIPNDSPNLPRLRAYLRDPLPSMPLVKHWPGKWVVENKWPPTDNDRIMRFYPKNLSNELLTKKSESCSNMVPYSTKSGLWTGEWISYGLADFPAEQNAADAYSLVYTTEKLSQSINILGLPTLDVTFSSDQPRAMLAARLCAVRPDGEVVLITYGVVNLCHTKNHSDGRDLKPNERYKAELLFCSTSYVLPAGYALRLSLSSVYFPIAWPSPNRVKLEVFTGGDDMVLNLPVIPNPHFATKGDAGCDVFYSPIRLGPALDVTSPDAKPAKFSRKLIQDLSGGQSSIVEVEKDDGPSYIRSSRSKIHSESTRSFAIYDEAGKTNAECTIAMNYKVDHPEYKDGIFTTQETISKLRSDESNFNLYHELKVTLNREVIFKKTWDENIPRQFV